MGQLKPQTIVTIIAKRPDANVVDVCQTPDACSPSLAAWSSLEVSAAKRASSR